MVWPSVPAMKTTSTARTLRQKWSQEQVIKVARERTRSMDRAHAVELQRMLDGLILEAGWSDEEFLNAFINDIVPPPKVLRPPQGANRRRATVTNTITT